MKVVLSQSLQRGSDEWSYCAWSGAAIQRSISVSRTSRGYEVHVEEPFENLTRMFPLSTPIQEVDDYMYQGILEIAKRLALGGTIDNKISDRSPLLS